MSRRRRSRRRRSYTGIVHVINITPGRRKAIKLNFKEEISIKTMDISGSLVSKSPIYDTNEKDIPPKEEISCSGSGNAR